MSSEDISSVVAIVPAAGVGKRMKSDRPKQYLEIEGRTVLEHTVHKLLSHPQISKVVVAITASDPYFLELPIAKHPDVIRVDGGQERGDSVLSGLKYVIQNELSDWVLVHDAARPCVELTDISLLIAQCQSQKCGGILATPVRDTMKRSNQLGKIEHTINREAMWHALTPQMYKTEQLHNALSSALESNVTITDEASAIEWAKGDSLLIQGSAKNIKITQPEDLALAQFYLQQQKDHP